MSTVNLSWLLSRKSFTVLCTLACNRYGVKTTALANSRANAFTLLDTAAAQRILDFLNALIEILEQLIPVKGYNRQLGKPITNMLQINLKVDRQ